MKRIVCILLAFVLLFGMVACRDAVVSDDGSSLNTGETENASGTENTGDKDASEKTEEEIGAAKQGVTVRVMSYNMQTGGADSVAERAPKALETIYAHDPDLLGAQEVNVYWLDTLETLGFFEIYGMIGEPRHGMDELTASNEYSCIFYKKSTFSLIDGDTCWLTETPNKISKLPQSDYYRIMTYALFEHVETGMQVLHVNTHLEWNHSLHPTNTEQTEILLSLTESVRAECNYPGTLFTGDFNEPPVSEGHGLMIGWDYADTREVAEKTTDLCTFYDGYRGEWTDLESEGTILDYCFVSVGDFVAERFDVDTSAEASDHFPVIAQLILLDKAS